MIKHEPIRSLFSRNHTTIFPKLGVFLAGPTPPNEQMQQGWRRKVIATLEKDERLNPSMVIVAPEPESGNWADLDIFPKTQLDVVLNKQIPWEWQYLKLCDITAFWLPTYWEAEKANPFPPNIGPTSRWEFSFYLQEYLKNPTTKSFIVGSPEDADSIKWAKRITDIHGISWHFLKTKDKDELVADSFIEAIATTLIKNKWEY